MTLIALPILIVAIIAVAVLSRSHHADARPAHTVGAADMRQLFQYFLLLGLLIIAAIGLTGVLTPLFNPGPEPIRDTSALARDLTFTTIGVPVFLGLGEWTRRRLHRDPTERSAWWVAYLTLASTITLVMAFPAVQELLMAAAGIYDYTGDSLARALVWGGAWAAHLWFGHRYATARQLQPRVLIGSLIGLALTAIGAGILLAQALNVLFGVPPMNVSATTAELLLEPAGILVVGSLIWAGHWLAEGVRGSRGKLWLAYVLLPGMGGGLVAALAGASLLLHTTLVWFLGEPSSLNARQHFASAAGFFAAGVVGLVVWWYHQHLLGTHPQERSEVRRVLEYLLAGIGLLAAGAALTMVVVAAFELLADSAERMTGATPINTVLAALVLMAVGLPVWWLSWRQIRRAVRADQAGELASPTRRIYLLSLFGIGGMTAVGALLALVYLLFNDALSGGLTTETLRAIRYPVGLLLTTAAIAGYHWTVYRADRQHEPQSPQPTTAAEAATPAGSDKVQT